MAGRHLLGLSQKWKVLWHFAASNQPCPAILARLMPTDSMGNNVALANTGLNAAASSNSVRQLSR